jgi:hypothetical protein
MDFDLSGPAACRLDPNQTDSKEATFAQGKLTMACVFFLPAWPDGAAESFGRPL